MPQKNQVNQKAKDENLEPYRKGSGDQLTIDTGGIIDDTDNSLKVGDRGSTLREDFQFQEKLAAFDRERIPERVVHARGSAAHGYFQPYEPMAEFTKAEFLQDSSVQTPVFVRFSIVGGSKGAADTVRDVRGFSVKFYTEEGNYDLVGNNIPVFFIQDAIKFLDIIHAVKPEPDHEMPQASTAHPSFWDFISLVPESTHMIMWLLSDRTLPRTYRTMEGFGVHTFRWVNVEGKFCFVKYHWKPIAGVHSHTFDEAHLKEALKEAGVEAEVVSKFGGTIKTAEGQEVRVDKTFLTSASAMFDAVYVPGGKASVEALKITGAALLFISEAFKHCKPIAATGEGVELLQAASVKGVSQNGSSAQDEEGVITSQKADASQVAKAFVQTIAQHRYWNRFQKAKVLA